MVLYCYRHIYADLVAMSSASKKNAGIIAGFKEYQQVDAYVSNLKELTKKTMRQLQAQANDAIAIYKFAPLVAARRQKILLGPLQADGSDAPGC